jgi:hypothetical protein
MADRHAGRVRRTGLQTARHQAGGAGRQDRLRPQHRVELGMRVSANFTRLPKSRIKPLKLLIVRITYISTILEMLSVRRTEPNLPDFEGNLMNRSISALIRTQSLPTESPAWNFRGNRGGRTLPLGRVIPASREQHGLSLETLGIESRVGVGSRKENRGKSIERPYFDDKIPVQ